MPLTAEKIDNVLWECAVNDYGIVVRIVVDRLKGGTRIGVRSKDSAVDSGFHYQDLTVADVQDLASLVAHARGEATTKRPRK